MKFERGRGRSWDYLGREVVNFEGLGEVEF